VILVLDFIVLLVVDDAGFVRFLEPTDDFVP